MRGCFWRWDGCAWIWVRGGRLKARDCLLRVEWPGERGDQCLRQAGFGAHWWDRFGSGEENFKLKISDLK